jgi:hypothetical protein
MCGKRLECSNSPIISEKNSSEEEEDQARRRHCVPN